MQRKIRRDEFREGSFLSFGRELLVSLIVGTIVVAVLIALVSP
jgi:hypothetical protein